LETSSQNNDAVADTGRAMHQWLTPMLGNVDAYR
jgi:hypothetical protein